MQKIIIYFLLAVVLASCSSARISGTTTTISKITFLHEYVIPFDIQYKNTLVGGLSGIDYNSKNNEYYLISDDRSEHAPARFYTAQIVLDNSKIDTVIFTDVTFLKDKTGNLYPNDPTRPDPEAMRYNAAEDAFVWSSEGERNLKTARFVNPAIIKIDRDGFQKDTFELPAAFYMKADEGPRQNGVFEGVAFSSNYKQLYVSTEEPLINDGPAAGTKDSSGVVRILQYDNSGRNTAQYAYEIEPVAFAPFPPGTFRVNGISDILWVNTDEFLIIERSYSTGRLSCTIKIFLASSKEATNIKNIHSLQQASYKPMTKRLLLNMDDLGRFIDNIEGVTFGPRLKNGKASLLFVADNNFNRFQKSQVFLFEVN